MFKITDDLLVRIQAFITKDELQPCAENVMYYCSSGCEGKCMDTCTEQCKSGAGNSSEW